MIRSQHTLTVIGSKAFIFGGKHPDGQLTKTDILAIALPPNEQEEEQHSQYTRYPAHSANPLGTGSVPLPAARYAHAACRRGEEILVYGGKGADGNDIDDGSSSIWAWHSGKARWAQYAPSDVIAQRPGPRSNHKIFVDEKQDLLILHGGESSSADGGRNASQETWAFLFGKGEWVKLPTVPTPPVSSSYVNSTLYSISSGGAQTPAIVETLDLHDFTGDTSNRCWSAVEESAKGRTPNPSARQWSTTLPVTTGFGRYYLLNFLGAPPAASDSDAASTTSSDLWSLQCPSEKLTGAGVKDLIRDKLPNTESGSFRWHEVEVPENKPEPRSYFGADNTTDGKSVVVWSGTDGKGVTASGGWIVTVR